MSRNITDFGTQKIYFDYAAPAISEEFNNIMHKVVRSGLYRGGSLSVESTSQVRISPMVVFIENSNKSSADLSVRIETTEDIVLNIDETDPFVICHYEWYNDPVSYMEVKTVAGGLIGEYDLILGSGVFTNGDLTGFDTTERDYISWDADTTRLGESATIVSSPSGGTQTNLSGETDIVTAIQEVFNRLIDLSGVEDDAVKNRHIDFGTSATQINSNDIPIGKNITTGGTIDSVTQSDITSNVIEILFDALADLSGADDNSVKERHVDFGTGQNQIDGDLLPLGTAISKVISEATNVDFANSKKIREALKDTIDRIAQVSDQVTTNKNSISSLQTDVNTNSDRIDKTYGIPVGTIMMFDGSNWQDDVTLPGWYACVAANSVHGAPDLEDKFIRGGSKGTKGVDYGVTGGSDTATLNSNNLPPHTHSISLSHNASIGATAPSHSHGMAHTHKYTRFTVDYHRTTVVTENINKLWAGRLGRPV